MSLFYDSIRPRVQLTYVVVLPARTSFQLQYYEAISTDLGDGKEKGKLIINVEKFYRTKKFELREVV